jgi:hypothetical protein
MIAEVGEDVDGHVIDVNVEDGGDQVPGLVLGPDQSAGLGSSDPGHFNEPPAAVISGGGCFVVVWSVGECHPSHPSGRQGI